MPVSRRILNKQKKNKQKNTRKQLNLKNKNQRKKTFKKKNKLLPIVYGKLYMTGCIHCDRLAPEWEILKKHSAHIVCYDIEAQEQQKLSKFNNIYKPYELLQIQGGYPTIYKLHKRGGAIIYYKGPRDNVNMLKWLQG
jgi:hypothetical protein